MNPFKINMPMLYQNTLESWTVVLLKLLNKSMQAPAKSTSNSNHIYTKGVLPVPVLFIYGRFYTISRKKEDSKIKVEVDEQVAIGISDRSTALVCST